MRSTAQMTRPAELEWRIAGTNRFPNYTAANERCGGYPGNARDRRVTNAKAEIGVI